MLGREDGREEMVNNSMGNDCPSVPEVLPLVA